MRGDGVQGVFTLFCGGVAQTCHDDRVVELKEQLVVEVVDREGQEGKEKEEGRDRVKENAPWMVWKWKWNLMEVSRVTIGNYRLRKKIYPPLHGMDL